MGINIPIIATPEHPILTFNGFKNAKDLSNKDYVVIPINKEIKDKTDFSYEKNPDFLRVLGLYIAEGSAQNDGKNRVTFSMNKNESNILNYINETIKNIFGLSGFIKYRDNKGEISFYEKRLADIFIDLGGKYAEFKRIHNKLLLIDPELQKEILNGWLIGDGCINKNRQKGTTISRELAMQMFDICLRNNIIPSIRVSNGKIDKNGVNHKIAYHILFTLNRSKKKQDFWRGNFSEHIFLRRIRKINKIKPEQFNGGKMVYNLTTTGTHTYTTNFIAVHNCGSHAGTHLKMILDYFDTGAKVYSPNYLWIKIKQIDGYPLEVGTDMRSIFKTLQSYGVCDYDLLPNDFSISLQEYSNPEIINKELDENAQPRIIKSYAFGNDIKKDIYLNKAVIILIDIGETWWTREKIEYPFIKKDGGHFVVAYGYDEDYIYVIDSADKQVPLKKLPNNYPIREIGTCVDLPDEVVKNLIKQKELLQKVVELLRQLLLWIKK
jgi:hypothetical protein